MFWRITDVVKQPNLNNALRIQLSLPMIPDVINERLPSLLIRNLVAEEASLLWLASPTFDHPPQPRSMAELRRDRPMPLFRGDKVIQLFLSWQSARGLQIEHQNGYVSRSDAADATGLADGCGFQTIEPFSGFRTQLRHGEIVKGVGNLYGVDFLQSMNLGLLTTYVARVLSFNHHLPLCVF